MSSTPSSAPKSPRKVTQSMSEMTLIPSSTTRSSTLRKLVCSNILLFCETQLDNTLGSCDVAIYRQTLHDALSSPYPSAPSTSPSSPSHASDGPCAYASSDLRGRPECAGGSRRGSGAWLHLRIPAVRLPSPAHDAGDARPTPWLYAGSLHAADALPSWYAAAKCYVFTCNGADAS